MLLEEDFGMSSRSVGNIDTMEEKNLKLEAMQNSEPMIGVTKLLIEERGNKNSEEKLQPKKLMFDELDASQIESITQVHEEMIILKKS
jgi:hypothetical protein